MKEIVELVKCDLCGKIIDTKNVPEDEYHYRYHIMGYMYLDTQGKDICPACAREINKIYNRKHNKVVDKYEFMDKYIEAVISDLSSDDVKCYINNKKDDYKEIIVTPGLIRGTMRSILFRDEFSNIFKS